MTQEEKAKAYDEALEQARKLLLGNEHSNTIRSYFEHIFPELRESEDERIRGRLIQVVSAIAGGWPFEAYGITKKEAIAYLEKQKYDRMKPIYDARESFESALEKAWNDYHNGYENVDKLEDDYVECAHAKGFREGYLFGIEKQKEHKWSPSEGEMGVLYKLCYISNQITDEDDTELTRLYQDLKREYFNGHSFENMFPSEKQKEQKPVVTHGETYRVDTLGTQQVIAGKMQQKPAEWSEEIIRKAVKEVGLTQHQIDWFKTNVFPPKQEWSKEDEKMLKNILWVLESYISKGESAASPSLIVSYPTYYKEIDWLKSLRPRWKPSEEHLSALLAVFNDPDNIGSQTCQLALADLYEQLKKL